MASLMIEQTPRPCRAFHLVVEAPQRLGCTNASDNYLVVPYSSPKFAEQSSGQATVARNLTAFFMAACTDDMTYKVRDFGMKMRLHMVQRLQADPAPDLFVKCANEQRVRQQSCPQRHCLALSKLLD